MFLGPERKAGAISRRDWDAFIDARRRGRIAPSKARKTDGVGDRQIGYDLKFLLSALSWATLAGDRRGATLLQRNRLKGLKPPTEESSARPTMSEGRYGKMLRAARDHMDWRFEMALVLAHEIGHRIGSIRQLRWSDVDLGGAVLPRPKGGTKPCSRHIMRDWWLRCERLAGPEHVEQMGWHSLRRKFATELKEIPLKDLCHLGGWKSPQTVVTCYQQADEGTMRKALEGRAERRVNGS
jgi:integrase